MHAQNTGVVPATHGNSIVKKTSSINGAQEIELLRRNDGIDAARYAEVISNAFLKMRSDARHRMERFTILFAVVAGGTFSTEMAHRTRQ